MSLPWRKRRYLDYLASEERCEMTLAERGALVELEDFHFKQGSIPADSSAQQRLLMAQPEEHEAIARTVARFFHPSPEDPDRLVNDDILAEIQEREEFTAKQAAKGRKGGRPKGSKKPNESRKKAADKPQESPGLISVKPEESQEEGTSSSKKFPLAHHSMSVEGDLFDQWWGIYPRKIAKTDAERAYRKIVVDGKAKPEQRDDLKPYPNFADRHAQLVTATKRWTAAEFSKREADKIPYPATYLRRLDWLSAPEVPANRGHEADSQIRERLAATPPPAMSWESHQAYQDRLRREGYAQ